MKTWCLGSAGAVASLLLLAASSAHAQEAKGLASDTQLILSADRLVPIFSYSSVKVTETEGNTTTTDTTSGSSTSLLYGAELGPGYVHTVPRVAADVAIGTTHLTVGGALAFGFTLGGSHEREVNQNNRTTTVTVDTPSVTVIGIAPRVGYVLPLGELFAFWPRGGFGFYSVKTKSEDTNNAGVTTTVTNSDSILSLDLDPQFCIIPIEHFFFNVGPLINIPLTGSRSSEVVRGAVTTTVDNDLSVWHLGASAGIGGWFDL